MIQYDFINEHRWPDSILQKDNERTVLTKTTRRSASEKITIEITLWQMAVSEHFREDKEHLINGT